MSVAADKKNPRAGTLMIHCPICDSDYGETLGVTGRMDGTLDATVVMRCDECETVYLSPPPVDGGQVGSVSKEQERVYGPHVRSLKQRIPDDTSFLCAQATDSSIVTLDPRTAKFGEILLPLSLESSSDSAALLKHVGSLLDDDGRICVVLGNTGSSCFATFGGRHWCGYRYPETRQHFGIKGVEVTATNAGLRVTSSNTRAAPHAWLNSARNLLRDWHTNRVLSAILTGPWLIPWLIAYLVESIAVFRGKGAVLVVELSKA